MEKKSAKSKYAQSAIIVSILIFLICIVIIAILWNIIFPLVNEKSNRIETESFTIDLNIKKAETGILGNSKITLARGSQGELDGIRFVFYDSEGNTKIEDRYDILEKLETREYSFGSLGLGEINKIEAYPIVNNKLGIKEELGVTKELSSYLVLSAENPNNIDNVSLKDNFGFSFWVSGNQDQQLLKQDYELQIKDKKASFSYNQQTLESSEELIEGDNHIVLSIGEISTIYVNNVYSGFSNSFTNIQTSGQMFVGEINKLMIFNKSLDINSVSTIYNSQKNN